jgi:hypothetical protein
LLTLRLPGKRALFLRWRVARYRLFCFIAAHRPDPSPGRPTRELVFVLGPSAPYVRWLTVLRGQRSFARHDTPRAV